MSFFAITPENLASQQSLYNESSIIMGLFIGYLISGSNDYKVSEYANGSIAYFCIQGRGLAAVSAVTSLTIESFLGLAVAKLQSTDVADGSAVEEKQREITYNFSESLHWLSRILRILAYINVFIFICAYVLSLYSIYAVELDFSFFWVVVGVLVLFILIAVFAIVEKYQVAQAKINALQTPRTKSRRTGSSVL
jgi:hypothetical protein